MSFAFTDTPLASTVIPPFAFALTETLLSVETEIPSPAVTEALPPAPPPAVSPPTQVIVVSPFADVTCILSGLPDLISDLMIV